MPGNTNRKKQTWPRYGKERLLEMRICDLGLNLKTGFLKDRIDKLYRELKHHGLVFKPHFWLSDEWFCPDGVPGVAIPFYLAHPRLTRLEREFMMEAEGGNKDWCIKLLRHETGHALLNAYKLDQRADWRAHFGRPNIAYPETYLPKPYSRSYVVNLPNWYAQAHPHEDWAETFAVWLQTSYNWRKRYKGWKALKKLEFVDSLMQEIGQKAPRLRNKQTPYAIAKMKTSLGEYYEDKVERYGMDIPDFFDFDLRKLFTDKTDNPKGMKASRYIRSIKRPLVDIVARWTGEFKYRINEAANEMIKRCDELELRLPEDSQDMLPEMSACLTMVVMNNLHNEGFHLSL